MRIIFVPQYPTPMRYQEWWMLKISGEFRKAGHEVIILGESYVNTYMKKRGNLDMFAPAELAIELELEQIKEYMILDLKPNDVLFLADLSFPGVFPTALFHHKRPERMYAFCHATSINKGDYFKSYRDEKFLIETAFAKTFDKVFVGSKYHQDKLGWNNTVVTYLPFPPLKRHSRIIKTHNLMSASRPNPQKVDLELENEIENLFTLIHRPKSNTWYEYFGHLSESKILLITSHEDTFGYQIVDAIINGCIPLARNGLAYPELLPREYLYDDKEELISRIDYILNSGENVGVPRLLCHDDMENFYNKILKEME
ncbi:MAG: hypothetical protein ACFFG0_00310 [Candidatus Thorarchaeota archaeon]